MIGVFAMGDFLDRLSIRIDGRQYEGHIAAIGIAAVAPGEFARATNPMWHFYVEGNSVPPFGASSDDTEESVRQKLIQQLRREGR
jgi:hypothetical protein